MFDCKINVMGMISDVEKGWYPLFLNIIYTENLVC